MSTRRKKDSPINPLRTGPDYTGSARHRQAISTFDFDRIYFIDESWNRLMPHRGGVDTGEEPSRFKGEIKFLPLKGEFLITEGAKRIFKVLAVIHELTKVKRMPPRLYVMLKEVFSFD